jgi:DNA (cytosine-5)-methyltransferase 1
MLTYPDLHTRAQGRPLLLDLFCCAGGAGKGYQMAGFYVVGVDIDPQPRYAGDEFHQDDALAFTAAYGWMFDAIHASPPCQRYSRMTPRKYRDNHPDLIAPTRFWLASIGVPYVIENVELAPLRNPIMLCGSQFGLKVYKHRLFESNVYLMAMSHAPHRDQTPRAGHGNVSPKGFITLAGGKTVDDTRAAYGINWMTGKELAQSVPPAYTHFIGRQLMTVVTNRREVEAA